MTGILSDKLHGKRSALSRPNASTTDIGVRWHRWVLCAMRDDKNNLLCSNVTTRHQRASILGHILSE